MNDCSLNKVNSAKYFGVIIDRKLNWIDHIAYIKNKISKGIRLCASRPYRAPTPETIKGGLIFFV